MSKQKQHVIDIDIHGTTYKDYVEFYAANASSKGKEVRRLAQKFILRWDFEVPLDQDNAVGKLKVSEGAQVLRTILEAVDGLFDSAKIGQVTVDMDVWDMDRLFLFTELQQERKVSEYEPMLHEVAKLEGVDPEKPLSLYNGILLVKAVTEASKKVFNGGN
jgi:hypothetical protein